MEMIETFRDCLFQPLIVQSITKNKHKLVVYDVDTITNSSNWFEDGSGICFIPDLVQFEITFDGDINSPYFKRSNATVYSIVATEPMILYTDTSSRFTQEQFGLIVKQLINIFSGDIMDIPQSLMIGEQMLKDSFSFKMNYDIKLFPCVNDGKLGFEAV